MEKPNSSVATFVNRKLNNEQSKLVADLYFIVGMVMEELNLSYDDIEDWHGFLCEQLCYYVLAHDNTQDVSPIFVRDYLVEDCKRKMQERISVDAVPSGLMRGRWLL